MSKNVRLGPKESQVLAGLQGWYREGGGPAKVGGIGLEVVRGHLGRRSMRQVRTLAAKGLVTVEVPKGGIGHVALTDEGWAWA